MRTDLLIGKGVFPLPAPLMKGIFHPTTAIVRECASIALQEAPRCNFHLTEETAGRYFFVSANIGNAGCQGSGRRLQELVQQASGLRERSVGLLEQDVILCPNVRVPIRLGPGVRVPVT